MENTGKSTFPLASADPVRVVLWPECTGQSAGFVERLLSRKPEFGGEEQGGAVTKSLGGPAALGRGSKNKYTKYI